MINTSTKYEVLKTFQPNLWTQIARTDRDYLLICPTPSALRLLLKLCDDFACEYDVMFNADKSKLLTSRSSKQCKVVRDIKGRPFHIGGRDIEQVDSFSHLGHIIDRKSVV